MIISSLSHAVEKLLSSRWLLVTTLLLDWHRNLRETDTGRNYVCRFESVHRGVVMKKVYLDIAGRLHSLYLEMLREPPSGYSFVTVGSKVDKYMHGLSRSEFTFNFQRELLNRVIPVNLVKAVFEAAKPISQDVVLTYATGHLVLRREPWVVDLEYVTQLAGYSIRHFKMYKGFIQRVLGSDECKQIICWTEAGKRTVLENLNCDSFVRKISVVPLAVRAKNFVKGYSNKRNVKLLFVGSSNIPLGEFEYKGGKEVLEAFLALREKYPEIQLVVRSTIPTSIKARFEGLPNVRLIEGIIPWDQMEQEFLTADIFVYPAHCTPGLAILDAMSYELPVVTTDVWANSEMVEDGVTGLIVKKSNSIEYYAESFIPIWNYRPGSQFMKSISSVDPRVVSDIVSRVSFLIESEEMRMGMGKAGRFQVEGGRFSLSKRSAALKSIFDKATST